MAGSESELKLGAVVLSDGEVKQCRIGAVPEPGFVLVTDLWGGHRGKLLARDRGVRWALGTWDSEDVVALRAHAAVACGESAGGMPMNVRKPRKGSRVVVVVVLVPARDLAVSRRVWRTIVVRTGSKTFTPRIGPLIVQVADEGKVWARGWDTPDARALFAEVALENSR